MTGHQRKLAVILHADVVGSTRLVQLDEVLAHERIRATFQSFSVIIANYGGSTHELRGDALVAEFSRASDAVSAAVAFQMANVHDTAKLTDDVRPEVRVGISLGEVVIADGTVTGAGVVLAQRLEQLAAPGGVVGQGSVSETVPTRLPFRFDSLGEQTLKGFDHPVRAFSTSLVDGQVLPEPETAAGLSGDEQRSADDQGHTVMEKARGSSAIAVLPFNNMSGDPEQEFFADGLTEDIITELSRFPDLVVISRNSTFVHKGKSINVPEVARDLNAQYVLEGSVRKVGNRVRITAQLIDAAEDRHLWAERYDRELEDIFALQDEMTSSIVATLPGRIEAAVFERVERKPTDNMAAYEYVLKAKVLHHRFRREDNEKALALLDQALALDPGYVHAHAWRACVMGQAWARGWVERTDSWEQIKANYTRTLGQFEYDSDVHRIMAALNILCGDHERAAFHQERGLQLNPNYDLLVVQQGELLTWIGKADEGVEWIRRAMQLNPHHPERFWSHLGRAFFVSRRYEEAVEAFKHVSTRDVILRSFLAASYSVIGDDEAARTELEAILAESPQLSVDEIMQTFHYRHATDRDHHRDALLRSGLSAGGTSS